VKIKEKPMRKSNSIHLGCVRGARYQR